MTVCPYFIFISHIFYCYIFFYRNALSFSTYVGIVFLVLLIKNAFKYVLKIELYQLLRVQLHVKEVTKFENHCVTFETSDYE